MTSDQNIALLEPTQDQIREDQRPAAHESVRRDDIAALAQGA